MHKVPTPESVLKSVTIPTIEGLVVILYQRNLFSIGLRDRELVRGRLGKNDRGFASIAVQNKKYYIAIEKATILSDFNVSLYNTKALLFSTGSFQESNWQKKRIDLLNRKNSEKLHFGEIFLDNLFLAIISRIFD